MGSMANARSDGIFLCSLGDISSGSGRGDIVIGEAEAVIFGGARLKMEMRREYNEVENKEKRGDKEVRLEKGEEEKMGIDSN
jgi:hypothetical protein